MKVRSAKLKVPKQKIILLKEFSKLKKLPKSVENDAKINEKKIQLKASVTLDDDGDLIEFQSFSGKFQNGSTAVAVYYKYQTNIYWNPVALCTQLNDSQAETMFGVEDMSYVEANQCGFENTDWISNDSADHVLYFDDLIEFSFTESQINALETSLGISGFKGYFDGWDNGNYNLYQSPAEILNGQKIMITDDLNSERLVDSVSFGSTTVEKESKSVEWTTLIVLIILSTIVLFNVRVNLPKRA